MVEQTPQRETAKICTVKDIIDGIYVVQEGWLANYIESHGRKLSRVNIIGLIVSKTSPYDFAIDDGTGTIMVTDFNQQKKIEKLKIGEPVMLIGRPRQTNDTKFIACEIVNNKQLLEDPNWMSYRKKELEMIAQNNHNKPEEIINSAFVEEKEFIEKQQVGHEEKPLLSAVETVTADITGEDIVSFIRKKDSGDGCSIEDIISYFGNDIDDHILTLITMGEIYEIKPGRVKVLE